MKLFVIVAVMLGLAACYKPYREMTAQEFEHYKYEMARQQAISNSLTQTGLQMYQLGQPYSLPSPPRSLQCHTYGNGTTTCY